MALDTGNEKMCLRGNFNTGQTRQKFSWNRNKKFSLLLLAFLYTLFKENLSLIKAVEYFRVLSFRKDVRKMHGFHRFQPAVVIVG